MKNKKIKPELLSLYLGQKCRHYVTMVTGEVEDRGITIIDGTIIELAKEKDYKSIPILRELPSMTTNEQEHLIWFLMNSPIRGTKLSKKDLKGCIDSVSPDDNAIVINFSYSCFAGELYVSTHSGLIRLYDGDQEDTELLIPFEPKMYAWLLSKGFDLFGLIDSGLAINSDQ